jgi:hypothetical protein
VLRKPWWNSGFASSGEGKGKNGGGGGEAARHVRLPCLKVVRRAQAAIGALATCDVMPRRCLQSRHIGGPVGKRESCGPT